MKNKVLLLVVAMIMIVAMMLTGCKTGDEKNDDNQTATNAPTNEETEKPTDEPTSEPTVEPTQEPIAEPVKIEVVSEVELKYTQSFKIEILEDGSKIVTDADGREFLLVERGNEIPIGYEDMTVINTPIENAFCASSTQVGFLNPLGETAHNGLGGVALAKEMWHLDWVINGMDSNKIQYLGDSWALDYEAIQVMQPDITFLYSGDFGQAELMAKLDELELPYVVINEYLEKGILAKLEWIKFMGTFFNADDEATKYYDDALVTYEQAVEKTINAENKPTVAWGTLWEGTINVSGSDSYVTELIENAGGVNLLKDYAGNSLSIEEFYNITKDADYWIYTSDINWTTSLTTVTGVDSPLLEIKAAKDGNVYAYQAHYFSATDLTHVIQLDLNAILQPELMGDDYELELYVKLPIE